MRPEPVLAAEDSHPQNSPAPTLPLSGSSLSNVQPISQEEEGRRSIAAITALLEVATKDLRANIKNPVFRERIEPRLKEFVENQRADIARRDGGVGMLGGASGNFVSLDTGFSNSRNREKPAIEAFSGKRKPTSRSENAPIGPALKSVRSKGNSRPTLEQQLR